MTRDMAASSGPWPGKVRPARSAQSAPPGPATQGGAAEQPAWADRAGARPGQHAPERLSAPSSGHRPRPDRLHGSQPFHVQIARIGNTRLVPVARPVGLRRPQGRPAGHAALYYRL